MANKLKDTLLNDTETRILNFFAVYRLDVVVIAAQMEMNPSAIDYYLSRVARRIGTRERWQLGWWYRKTTGQLTKAELKDVRVACLNDRQRRICKMIACGCDNIEIAERLDSTNETIGQSIAFLARRWKLSIKAFRQWCTENMRYEVK